MIVKMTPELKAKIKEVDAQYDPLIEKYSKIAHEEVPPNPPDDIPMPKRPVKPAGMTVKD